MRMFGLVVKGETKGLVDRIVGVEKLRGTNYFLIACSTDGCSGSFNVLERRQRGVDKCKACLRVNVFGHWLDKRYTEVASRFVAMSRTLRPDGYIFTKFWLRCATSDCWGVFLSSDFLQKGSLHCLPCRAVLRKRMWLGEHVQEDHIWAIRHKLVGSRLSARGLRQWYVKCVTDGCDSHVRYRTDKKYKGTCLPCRTTLRRKRPYESHYNSFLVAAKRRGKECTLTYRQFANVSAIGMCFYCESLIPKTEFLRHGEPVLNKFGIDRIDNAKGYERQNIVPCCFECNTIKSNKKTATETVLLMSIRKGNMQRAKDIAASGSFGDFLAAWYAMRKVEACNGQENY